MSRSVNKAIIVGNLGADPDIRSVSSGARVANISVATSRSWTDRSGQHQEKTEWHRIILWEKLADIAERFLKKGDQIYIEGEIEYRSYDDKDGVTKYVTEIRARELVMLGGGGGQPSEARQPATAGASRSSGSAAKPRSVPTETYDDFPVEPFEDDGLPF